MCDCFDASQKRCTFKAPECTVKLPPREPHLNAVAEGWVRSVKTNACRDSSSLESPRSNVRCPSSPPITCRAPASRQRELIAVSAPDHWRTGRRILCKQRLGGMLNYYHRAA